MKRFIKLSTMFSLATIATVNMTTLAHAQSLLPGFIDTLVTDWSGTKSTSRVRGFIRLGLTLAFGVVILLAVAYSIMAATKYVRSQGDAGKVEEANKAIKAIFQGIAMMFVGIIGVVVVFFIFNVAFPNPSLPTVCVKYPDSATCRICSEGTRTGNSYVLESMTGQDNSRTNADCNKETPKYSTE